MRILFYCDEYPPAPHGGIGRVTQIVAEALAVKGHYVVAAGYNALFQSDKASISPQTEILQNGVHTYRLVSNRLYSNRLVIWKSLFCCLLIHILSTIFSRNIVWMCVNGHSCIISISQTLILPLLSLQYLSSGLQLVVVC